MDTTPDAVIRILEQSTSFRGLAPSALRAIAYVLKRRTLDAGELVFAEGDVGDEAFFVLSGAVEITTRMADGTELVRARVEAPSLFGELALFGSGRRTASARAGLRTTLGALAYGPFTELIRAWPDVAIALLRIQTERFIEIELAYRALRAGDRAT